ncbi:MAG: hypothetical protein ACYTG0_17750 [Planctomycetota bacterium]
MKRLSPFALVLCLPVSAPAAASKEPPPKTLTGVVGNIMKHQAVDVLVR